MSNLVAIQQGKQVNAGIVDRVISSGDLAKLSDAERVSYYGAVCASVGLNPLTRPFEYINLNGKLTLYARRDATDQLRALNGVSITIVGREHIGDCYVVTARAIDRAGRQDESTGVVTVGSLKGEAMANALMKAETKAKRRVTLSICGLGWLDESELHTTGAQPVKVDAATGVIVDMPPPMPRGPLAKAEKLPPVEASPAADRALELAEMMQVTTSVAELAEFSAEAGKLKGQVPDALMENLRAIFVAARDRLTAKESA